MTIFTTQTQAGIIRNQKNQQQILQGNHKRLAVINLETAWYFVIIFKSFKNIVNNILQYIDINDDIIININLWIKLLPLTEDISTSLH